MTEQRRLAAIVSADVAGYSRLMGRDESGTLAALKALRQEVVDPAIASHGGRIVKTTGDGLLLEFPSVVNAVRCAVEVQAAMADRTAEVPEDQRFAFRIGINIGDIIVDGDDIFGDGVNVAARLQEIASPGGICISSRVHEDVRDRLDTAFEDGGTQTLKNIARPVQVWRWQPATAALPKPAPAPTALPLPDKPSIAVLPFQNMSGDPEQEYFVDGLVEDIITGLSRFKALFVIARNSTFTYKGKAVDIRQVGRELGVRYVLEGSVRKAANRLRISGQLIDAATGTHLWADRFDGALDDIFDLQDRVTTSVVGVIAPKLEQAEIERAKRKPVENLDAYDCYLRGLARIVETTKDAELEARHFFYRAIELEPDFATPYAMAARCYSRRKAQGWILDRAWEEAEVRRLASRISVIGRDDAVALCIGGYALAWNTGDLDDGDAMAEQALLLNPNLAIAWLFSGYIKMHLGEHELAIERVARSMRLSPRDPEVFNAQMALAQAHLFIGRHDEASSWVEKAVREKPNHVAALSLAASCHALAGRLEQAQKAIVRLRQLDPSWRMSKLRDKVVFRRPEDVARIAEGLRRAGLPE
jgi:TolB-like protein/class 3 adenylate cyclase